MTADSEPMIEASGEFVSAEHVLSLRSLPALQESEVQLWPFELRAEPATLQACERVLSAPERDCAGRFVFEKDRHRYVVAHGVLRHLLFLYVGVAPQEVGLEYSDNGKPRLRLSGEGDARFERANHGCHFNLSHSQHRALIGFSRGREIGVDLEMARPEVDVLSLAESCFFGSEIAAIRAASAAEQQEAFFRYWVAKEAVLKGEGIGLGYPLDRFEVRFTAVDGKTGYITSSDTTRLSADWTVRVLRLADGWPAAVAARGEQWMVRVCG
jgi:4'-phosphopantetheinyl transferase